MARHLAALDGKTLIEGDSDGLAGDGFVERRAAAPVRDCRDPRGPVRWREQQRVAALQPSGRDPPHHDAATAGPVHLVNREPERQRGRRRRREEPVERLHEGRAVVPRHALGAPDDVVAMARRDGHHVPGLDAEAFEIAAAGARHGVVALGGVVRPVHLGHRNHRLPNADEPRMETEIARRGAAVLGGADHHDRDRRGRRTGGHGVDERVAVQHVDDGVFAARRANRRRRAGALGRRAGVVAQTSDQRRLALAGVADHDDIHDLVARGGRRRRGAGGRRRVPLARAAPRRHHVLPATGGPANGSL